MAYRTGIYVVQLILQNKQLKKYSSVCKDTCYLLILWMGAFVQSSPKQKTCCPYKLFFNLGHKTQGTF